MQTQIKLKIKKRRIFNFIKRGSKKEKIQATIGKQFHPKHLKKT